ncbi:hypothetical protein QQP08_007668 [Theobroma cacao]|nr:hypothetical protein QQP08_007668 [Theobroma cacao]
MRNSDSMQAKRVERGKQVSSITAMASTKIISSKLSPIFNIDNSISCKLRQGDAVLVENLDESKFLAAYSADIDYKDVATTAEFKLSLNFYLKELVVSPVRSFKDIIAFNNKFRFGLKGSEPTLIEIAYAFEQATRLGGPLRSSTEAITDRFRP